MAAIHEIITTCDNGTLSFGDYTVTEKKKVSDYEVNGALYKVKTHNVITRLEKDGKLLLETVPGATVHKLSVSDMLVSFSAEGRGDTKITLELEPEKNYHIFIDNNDVGHMISNLAGKVNFSLELTELPQEVRIEKRGE